MAESEWRLITVAAFFFMGLQAVRTASKSAVNYEENHRPAGKDKFFEEQRAYEAYPYLRRPGFYRGIGFVLMALSALLLALELMD